MEIRLIDSHCHVQHPRYDADRETVIRHSLDAGIGMIVVGNDRESSRQAVALAEHYDGIWAAVGLHPNDDLSEVWDAGVFCELANHSKVVAIGETGLDYYHSPDMNERRLQHERFQQHLSLARETQKPLIIHSREALDDTFVLLREAAQEGLRGVVHSFTGTPEQAHKFLELGFFIGLNGIITFSDSYDALVDNIPLDHTLCETDAPFLAPIPHRGKRNEPSYVSIVARHIASRRSVSFEEICRITTQNAEGLFKL